MFCKFCGTENANDEAFCSACGNALRQEAAPQETYEETVPESNESYYDEVWETEVDAAPATDKGKVFGAVGFGISIAALISAFTCNTCMCPMLFDLIPYVLGLPALALGIIGLVLSKKNGFNNLFALLAIIFSGSGVLIALVIMLLNWALLLIGMPFAIV